MYLLTYLITYSELSGFVVSVLSVAENCDDNIDDDDDVDDDIVEFNDASQTTTTATSQLALVARQPFAARQPAAAANGWTTRPVMWHFCYIGYIGSSKYSIYLFELMSACSQLVTISTY